MSEHKSGRNSRAGLYISQHARDRLNRFIATYRLQTDQFMSQSTAVEYLLDHYESTAPQPERVREVA